MTLEMKVRRLALNLQFWLPFQIRDFLGLYNRLSHRCFAACCNTFTERKLTPEQVNWWLRPALRCTGLCIELQAAELQGNDSARGVAS